LQRLLQHYWFAIFSLKGGTMTIQKVTEGQPLCEVWERCDSYVLKRAILKSVPLDSEKSLTGKLPTRIDPNDALEWIYGLLTTLDSKASALMRLNGVMLAATTFLLGAQSKFFVLTKSDVFAIAVTGSTSALSIVLCLFVVAVKWPFLGHAVSSYGYVDFEPEFRSLQDEASRRQKIYRIAWGVSVAGGLFFLVDFVTVAVRAVSNAPY
jgi:hypothetical protein